MRISNHPALIQGQFQSHLRFIREVIKKIWGETTEIADIPICQFKAKVCCSTAEIHQE